MYNHQGKRLSWKPKGGAPKRQQLAIINRKDQSNEDVYGNQMSKEGMM